MTDIKPVARLSQLPEPAHRERIYGGHGNELVHVYYSARQMHEYARQHVYLIDQRNADAAADAAALVRTLRDVLAGIDEAYCRAGSPLTRDERNEDRKRLMAARQSFAAANAFLAQQEAG